MKEEQTPLLSAFFSHWPFMTEDDPELGAARVQAVCLLDSSFFCCYGNMSLLFFPLNGRLWILL